MKLFDCHVHSYFSADSNASLESIVQAAQSAGLAGVVLTDHIDSDVVPNTWYFSYDERAAAVKAIQQTTELKIFQGLEIGYQASVFDQMNEITQTKPWDFIILSVHMLDGKSLCKTDWIHGRSAHEVVVRYLEAILESVNNFKNYDVVGHIGYVLRYAKQCSWDDIFKHMDVLDAIFDTVIADNKALEINTSGWRQGLESPIPHERLLARYHERGGRYITLGSDAHKAEDISAYFDRGLMLVERYGFELITMHKKTLT